MKVFFLLTAAFVATQAASFLDLELGQWIVYKNIHAKSYETLEEEKQRMNTFLENAKHIADHNEKYDLGLVSYQLGLNEYADMSHDEFTRTLNGYRSASSNLMDSFPEGEKFVEPIGAVVPESRDWRQQGAVTPVKNQGQCGSCWSFSTTGGLEAQHFFKTGNLISLSEQDLVDCTMGLGNYGCDGGWVEIAYQYIRDNHGIDSEASYPYEAADDKCRYNPKYSVAQDSGFVKIAKGNETQLKVAVGVIGPVSIAMDARHRSFQFYKKGVYEEPDCTTDMLDHAILIVGYGHEDGKDYWLVKNSWGTSWGEEGYFKILRNRNNHCGVSSDATYPLI